MTYLTILGRLDEASAVSGRCRCISHRGMRSTVEVVDDGLCWMRDKRGAKKHPLAVGREGAGNVDTGGGRLSCNV
jgi:hypothetical protein